MIMKRWYYLIGLLALFFPVSVFAVPAYPGLIKMKQPTGEEISVYLKGDEKVHWMESQDGYSLLYDKEKRIVYATTDEKGDMIPSPFVFQDNSLRSSVTDEQLTNIPKGLRYSASQISMLKGIWKLTNSQVKNTSLRAAQETTVHAICTLVQFPDVPFTKTIDDFEQLLNQAGYSTDGAKGSVRDYYYEDSYGQLNLVVTVVGIFTAPDSMKYYGENVDNSSMNIDHIIELAGQAASYAFSQPGINPADFDNNNDGYIDAFHFIFAGYGEESGGSPDAIWSHEVSGFSPFSFKGKYLDTYSCSSELRDNSGTSITRIGVICHEMAHIFGIPDFYDTDGDDSGGDFTGTGKWDLMADGSWNPLYSNTPPDLAGVYPAHINMYARIQLGWVNPVILNSPQDITDMPNSAENPVAYIYNSPVTGEYFILENRQQKGFDSYVPGHGLLIYHVSLTQGDISSNQVNNTSPQKMYPVCASSTYKVPATTPASYGNINSAGCPFPGTSNKTAFTDSSTPSSITWSGMTANAPVTEITEKNQLVSFKFMQNGADPVSNFTVTKNGSSVLLKWNKPNDGVSGYNIYRNNALLIKLAGADNTSYTQYNVGAGDNNYCVTAYYTQNESAYRCQEINIGGSKNGYPSVRNLQATDKDNSVNLSWDSPEAKEDWVTHSSSVNSIIYYNTVNFSTVVRFTADEMKDFAGTSLTQVNFYLYNKACTHTIQVWQFTNPDPQGNYAPPLTPTYSQVVKSSTTPGDVTINLDTPLKIQAGKELWIGINYQLSPMTFVTAVDGGPKVPNRNFLIIDKTWYLTSDADDENFYISGGLFMTEMPSKYSIYRDNVLLNNSVVSSYLDKFVPTGRHIYCVSGVYSGGESEQTCVQSPYMTGCVSDIVVQVWDDVLSVVNNPANNGGYTFTKYQWFKNGMAIQGETSGNLYLVNDPDKATAQYTCQVTTSTGQVMQTCPTLLTLRAALSAYPNPTTGKVVVKSQTLEQGDKIDVFNSTGMLVKHFSASPRQTEIDLGNQPKGTYIIKVNGEQVKIIIK